MDAPVIAATLAIECSKPAIVLIAEPIPTAAPTRLATLLAARNMLLPAPSYDLDIRSAERATSWFALVAWSPAVRDLLPSPVAAFSALPADSAKRSSDSAALSTPWFSTLRPRAAISVAIQSPHLALGVFDFSDSCDKYTSSKARITRLSVSISDHLICSEYAFIDDQGIGPDAPIA